MQKNIASFIENADESQLRLLFSTVEKKLMRMEQPAPELVEAFNLDECSRHLVPEQLALVTSGFSSWFADAGTPAQKRSRGRIWLAFLFIRYGALRLGEVLAIDESRDIDYAASAVQTGGAYPRPVQMPEDVMREIKALLAEPVLYSQNGRLLDIDPGYLRRKFYEMAARLDLPKDLLNPRNLRQARLMELLGAGVPVKAVQIFMGQPDRGSHLGLGDFSVETGQRIVQQYLNREVKMKTSARNAFMGKVSSINSDGLLTEVELTTLTGLKIVAVITEESAANLGLASGRILNATVKAPWVILTEAEEGLKTSARNKFSGKVSAVKTSEIASEVLVDLYEGSKVCALITNESVNRLDIVPGKDIMVMFKAFSVILNAD